MELAEAAKGEAVHWRSRAQLSEAAAAKSAQENETLRLRATALEAAAQTANEAAKTEQRRALESSGVC